jgi:UDP-2-acetamido-2-deoxy-ribo-hexuluronate aminotransferase
MHPIQMVDLTRQYLRIKDEADAAMQEVVLKASFINGPAVKQFENALAEFTGAAHVIGCANGTDALQVALMALDLPQGSEIITPSFSYAALAEVIHLLGHKPVYAEVDPNTFLLDPTGIEALITPKTRVIAPVHLYGQTADMEAILAMAEKHGLYVVEDTAQAIGSVYTFSNGVQRSAGTMGHIGTTSFFPSKNLGCFGDGGAIFTNNEQLATRIRMICNHGQRVKYTHEIVGLNSRLDTLQAALLSVKLKYLREYEVKRNAVAGSYDAAFINVKGIDIPGRTASSTHVFHQYTLTLANQAMRDSLKNYLASHEIPSMIYYPTPLHRQQAYKQSISMPLTESLCQRVLSLPVHTEMDHDQLDYIIATVQSWSNEAHNITA